MKNLNRYGFSLTELAIVLTIVGLLIGGIWMAAATVLENKKRDDFSSEMLQIIVNTKTLFAYDSRHFNPSFSAQLLYVSFALGDNNPAASHYPMLGSSIRRQGPMSNMIIPVVIPGPPAAGVATGFNNATAIAAGIIPANLIVPGAANGGGGNIVHPYATNTSVDSITLVGAGNTITATAGANGMDLPPNACVSMATTVGTQAIIQRLNISVINVNGTPLASTGGVPNPVTAAAAATACNQTGMTNTVAVSFGVP